MSEKIGKSIFRVKFTVEHDFYSIHDANQHFSIYDQYQQNQNLFFYILCKNQS